MFSSSVAGGSVCFRCQLRAVTRRAIPSVAAAQIRGPRRQYASEASNTDAPEDDLETILRNQRHDEARQRQQPSPSWAQNDQQEPEKTPKQPALERRTCPYCRKLFNNKQSMQRHKYGGFCPSKPTTDEPAAKEQGQDASGALPEAVAVDDGLGISVESLSVAALEGAALEGVALERETMKAAEGRPLVRRTFKGEPRDVEKPKENKKRFRRGSMKLEADATVLEVNTLGKPAEVIVLRDRGQWKRKPLPVLENREGTTQSTLAAEDLLPDEEAPRVEDYLEFINGLKPDHKTLSAREFKSLYNALLSGFTSLQLEYYVEWHRKGQPPFAKKEDETFDEDLVIDEDLALYEDLPLDEDIFIDKDLPLDVDPDIYEDYAVTEDIAGSEDATASDIFIDQDLPLDVDPDIYEDYVLNDEDYVVTEDIAGSEDVTANEIPAEIEEAMASEDATASDPPAETEEVVANENVAAEEDQLHLSSLFDKPVWYPWMVEQSHWSPEVAGAVEETEYPLRGYILKSMRPKQRLAVQLMRECWGVSAQELQDGNGHLDVRVRDLEFKLLTLGNQRWLHKISRIFLKEGKQMEIIRSQNLIRIVAPKVVAETCVNALNETLEKIKTKSFSLDQVPMQHLDDGILAELGKITNSVVEFGSSNDEIRVSWIHIRNDESDAQLEDLGDVIFRLLLTGHTSASTSNKLIVYPEITDKGKFIEDFSDKNRLSWINRRREWARLCLPLASGKPRTATAWPLSTEALKYKVEPSAEDLTLPSSTLKPKVDAFYNEFTFPRPLEGTPLAIPKPRKEQPEEQKSEDVQGLESTKPTSSGWMPFKVSTNAVFGHILHEHSPSLIKALSQPTTALVNWPRALSPLIPPIANMDLPGWVPYNNPIDATSTVLMRFVPYTEVTNTIKDTADTTTQAPQLELRLDASDRRILGARSLRAVSQTSISDILLPTEHVDVRSTQRLYAELPGRAIDSTEGMAPLVDFLRASRLEPGKGELVTPPRLCDLGLPGWLLRGGSSSGSSSGSDGQVVSAAAEHQQQGVNNNDHKGGLLPPTPGSTPSDEALVPTSYVFAGLEVHRTLQTTYDGWKLVYTSVEAGQGGGRRAELSLEAVPGYDKALRRAGGDVNTSHFLQSMYQLARGLKGRVQEGPDGEVRTSISWVDQEWSGV
ncbi:hypothetical protein VMCG_01662 [Cytospora schulzeri]|uniref:Uncharacterized protein n=1 Tax=Cytospora schulzeri TaxID=448051 RepID=A0A423X3C4_9PEZI|nr:hypothetical protein VMCG_01662 [Valsa malicola]